MSKYNVAELPEIDRRHVERGICPWCLSRLIDNTLIGGHGDECPECGDEFMSGNNNRGPSHENS